MFISSRTIRPAASVTRRSAAPGVGEVPGTMFNGSAVHAVVTRQVAIRVMVRNLRFMLAFVMDGLRVAVCSW
ncbi:hypothetical protein BSZ40_04180 [Buchananella hordeovulneris]|uniref:Uncharacterized protein n=1 Tax=Buchananella hordeovulneris TaxID=52770 RepID=A0A1Q5PXC8_9ACTO|nr:hypothetical protein BSZ40_04180 [Buchananella hordeovulneris]